MRLPPLRASRLLLRAVRAESGPWGEAAGVVGGQASRADARAARTPSEVGSGRIIKSKNAAARAGPDPGWLEPIMHNGCSGS